MKSNQQPQSLCWNATVIARSKPRRRGSTFIRFLIIALLVVLTGGTAAYFIQELRFPYRHRSPVKAAPARDFVQPVVAELEKARKLRDEGKLAEAQMLLREQLRLWPDAPQTKAVRELLGEINTALFFSAESLFGKTEYVVKRGDSLWRIARKLESTPAMIMRANDLESDRIHPGDRLIVPAGEFTLTLDLAKERAVVHHGNGFFKQYAIVTIDLPRSTQPRLATKVAAITYWKDGEMVSAATPAERAESTPRMHLGRQGYVLYGVSEEGVANSAVELSAQRSGIGTAERETAPDIPAHGIALMKEDLEELELFINRGTPVTILRQRES